MGPFLKNCGLNPVTFPFGDGCLEFSEMHDPPLSELISPALLGNGSHAKMRICIRVGKGALVNPHLLVQYPFPCSCEF